MSTGCKTVFLAEKEYFFMIREQGSAASNVISTVMKGIEFLIPNQDIKNSIQRFVSHI